SPTHTLSLHDALPISIPPAAIHSWAAFTSSHGSEIDKLDARRIDVGSRPASSAERSMIPLISASSAALAAQPCHASAYRPAIGRVRFRPSPPIQIGGCGRCTGFGSYVAFLR